MAEVLVKYTEPVRAADGKSYWAQACGESRDDNMWEGWIEFSNGDRKLRTGAETEQPNRGDLRYWAEGLTYAYLQGALERALRLESGPLVIDVEVPGEPMFDRPADDRPVIRRVTREPGTPAPHAILDPYAVYAEGEHILRQQLHALSRDQLVNIARAYDIVQAMPASIVENGSRDQIAANIVRSVRRQFEGRFGKREFGERKEL
jgi:hypothetical protein